MKKLLIFVLFAIALVIPVSASAQEGPGWGVAPLPITEPTPVTTNQEGPGW